MKSITAADAGFEIRPPWGDELQRLLQWFPVIERAPNESRVWYWVAVAKTDGRLLGALLLGESTAVGALPPVARVYVHTVRSTQVGGICRRLLDEAERKARSLGLGAVTGQFPLDSVLARELGTRAYVCDRVQDLYRLDIARALERDNALADQMIARHPVSVARIDDQALPSVRRICAHWNLLTEDRVFEGFANDGGYDPRFSFIAGDPGSPAAVVLIRTWGEKLYLEVLAAEPDREKREPAAVVALMQAALKAADAEGWTELWCTVVPNVATAVSRLLRRRDGCRESRVGLFRLNLS